MAVYCTVFRIYVIYGFMTKLAKLSIDGAKCLKKEEIYQSGTFNSKRFTKNSWQRNGWFCTKSCRILRNIATISESSLNHNSKNPMEPSVLPIIPDAKFNWNFFKILVYFVEIGHSYKKM